MIKTRDATKRKTKQYRISLHCVALYSYESKRNLQSCNGSANDSQGDDPHQVFLFPKVLIDTLLQYSWQWDVVTTVVVFVFFFPVGRNGRNVVLEVTVVLPFLGTRLFVAAIVGTSAAVVFGWMACSKSSGFHGR